MNISIYSVLTSFLWFNLFVLILCFLRWKLKIVLGYNLLPLIMLLVLSMIRLFFPFEPSFSIVLRSKRILPFIQELLQMKIITIGATNITLALVAGLILSLVSSLLFAYLLFSIHRKLKEVNASTPTENIRLLLIFERIKEEFPSRHKCSLHVSETCSVPCIFGLANSAIILPAKMLSLSDQDLYYILKHEWQHHLGNDVLVKLFVEGLCCVMWWNPLVFLLRYNLNQTLELKCDVSVTKSLSLEQRLDYAEALLHVLALCVREESNFSTTWHASIPFSGMIGDGQKSADINIIQRFDVVLESTDQNRKIGAACGVCLILLFLISFCFVIQPYSLPPEEDLETNMSGEATINLLQITSETSLLVDNQDGTYSLFVNGDHWHDISAQAATHEPYQSLPVITME